MPTLIAVDHDPFAQPDGPQPGTPQVAPTGLPRPGDATPLSGNPMSGMGITPPYQSPEDMRQIGLAAALGERNRGVIQAIQNTPGHIGAVEYAKKIIDAEADVANTQRGVIPMLQALDGLEKRYIEAGPKVAPLATGPDYAPSDGPAHYLLPDTSSQSYQNTRAFFRGGDYATAADLNNQMQHAKEGIATLFKAIPGSGKSGATDQAQATLSEMVNAALHSRNPETFFRIMHDAKNFVRGLGQFPQLDQPKSFLPPEWSGGDQAAAQQPAEAAPAQVQAPAGPNAAHIAALKANSSAQMRAFFDEKFGPGAAARVLRGN